MLNEEQSAGIQHSHSTTNIHFGSDAFLAHDKPFVDTAVTMFARLLCIFLFASTVSAGEVVRAGRWEFHSSFWMSLHQTLMHDASTSKARDTAGLTPGERTAWEAAVVAYRQAAGKGAITFSRPMERLQDALSQVADNAVNAPIDDPLAGVIRAAAPIYRAHWWTADDAANRFFIRYASAMLSDAGEELAREHEAIYHEKMPQSIRVDITPYAEPFGAYSLFLIDAGYITTMSCRDSGYQGLASLEMLLHEASHSIVDANNSTVSKAIAAAGKKLNIKPPGDLWHAILFATSGELTRRALLIRGVRDYKPSTEDMFTRVWPKYREPIETYWYPYLSGKGTIEEAIEKVVAAIH